MVCAEIPEDEEHRVLISRYMLHGPCGPQFPLAKCMKNGKCSKGFPKRFSERTYVGEDSFPVYRRRPGYLIEKGGFQYDSRWVVPHNVSLLRKYEAHINVEVSSGIRNVKYLYKYAYKGPDMASVELNLDEVKSFQECRYISASEASWRIFGFPLFDKSHSVERLDVHVEDQQLVFFNANENLEAINDRADSSKLCAWFRYNATHDDLNVLEFNVECVVHELSRVLSMERKTTRMGKTNQSY